MIEAVGTARGLALIALVVVLVASITNNVATAVQSQDNCQDIQKVNNRLRTVITESRDSIKRGDRDIDFQALYGFEQVRLANGETVPNWVRAKMLNIAQSNKLIDKFKEEKCPLPLLGISHRD